MVKTALKYTYLGGKTPPSLQTEESTFWKMYYDRKTRVMVNQSVNEFYTWFDALPQDVAFPLDIAATFFNTLITNVRELLISEMAQVPPRPPTENNHQGNQRLLLVINAAMEAVKKTRTIKAAVQPASGSRHPKKFM